MKNINKEKLLESFTNQLQRAIVNVERSISSIIHIVTEKNSFSYEGWEFIHVSEDNPHFCVDMIFKCTKTAGVSSDIAKKGINNYVMELNQKFQAYSIKDALYIRAIRERGSTSLVCVRVIGYGAGAEVKVPKGVYLERGI
jgi:hypothetical protein